MKRLLVLLLAAGALPAGAGAQQVHHPQPRHTLPAFGSDAEAARFVAYHQGVQRLRAALRRDSAAAVRAAMEAGATCAAAVTDVARAAVPSVPGGSAAPPAVIRGRVVAASHGQAIYRAHVSVEGTKIVTTTGMDGGFRLAVPAGRLGGPVSVSVSVLGYARARRALTLAPGDSARAVFCLTPPEHHYGLIFIPAVPIPRRARDPIADAQPAGVDEGEIVKAHGEHLVILRRGRLYTVRVGAGGARTVSSVDAHGPGLGPEGAWYDEMLVSGDVVIVIGDGRAGEGTEVGLFRIDAGGRLRHASTHHLRAIDHEGSRDFSIRLADGKLVFYTTLQLGPGEDAMEVTPALRRWRPGALDGEFRPVGPARPLYRPARPPNPDGGLVVHAVTVCGVARAELDCAVTRVLGPGAQVFHVSPGSLFFWTRGWRMGKLPGTPSIVYRVPLDGSAPSALGVEGNPIDEHSFLESADGHLNVLVRAAGTEQWNWSDEWAKGEMAMLRLPLAGFGDGTVEVSHTVQHPLPTPGLGVVVRSRFVGRRLLYSVESGSSVAGGGRSSRNAVLHVVEWSSGRLLERLALPRGVDRIDALGSGALVVGVEGQDLHLATVRLSATPALAGSYTLPGASWGSLLPPRFLHRPDGEEAGVLGVPVRDPRIPGREPPSRDSASVLFFRSRSLELTELGALSARAGGMAGDGCKATCVDWYGNARPIFFRGRVFALLGHELVEGELRGGRIREVRRTAFGPGN